MKIENWKTAAVVLKPERDKHVRNKHPWVFMGAIESYPNKFEDGGILPVVTSRGDFIGYGYFNRGQSISGRMFSFSDQDPEITISENIKNALKLREIAIPADTTAYRLINGEGDDLPGLVVDRYDEVLVMQANTLGIEKLKPLILKTLRDELGDRPIYEKSGSPTRRKEGLEDFEGWLGEAQAKEPLEILEHGLKFAVSLAGAQKTGLFLDQREMRQLVRNYAAGRSVLNCFSYTGGFSVYALAGGAKKADSVDISQTAIEGAKQNVALNGFSSGENGFYAQDVLEFLSARTKKDQYDFIILDPPAFAKRASDVRNATRGYTEINQAAMEKLPAGGLLLTSSCSAQIDRDLFQTIIFQAAKYAKRKVRILSYHVLAADHPVNLFYPEGDYLKSLLLYLE
jgi:23S rRNA (cytosine1962-C5)-methyltransferase